MVSSLPGSRVARFEEVPVDVRSIPQPWRRGLVSAALIGAFVALWPATVPALTSSHPTSSTRSLAQTAGLSGGEVVVPVTKPKPVTKPVVHKTTPLSPSVLRSKRTLQQLTPSQLSALATVLGTSGTPTSADLRSFISTRSSAQSPGPASALGLPTVPPTSGPGVALIQAFLRASGALSGPVDGLYGPVTRAAIARFQAQHGLAVDGVVGRQTWAAFFRTI